MKESAFPTPIEKCNILNMNKKIIFSGLFFLCFGVGVMIPRFLLGQKIDLVQPHKGEAAEVIYATGTVEPSIMVPIAPRNSGHLLEMSADEGQTVKKGDILAQLENTEQQASIADLTAQLKFAEGDFDRKRQLYNSKSLSRDIFESAKANVESLTAQLNRAKALDSYTTLIAPADGLIIKRDGEIGELISAGQPIFYLSCCAPLRITAEVDEEDIPQVKTGQDVLIQTDAFADKVFKGTLSATTPKGDPIARSYRVRIAFDNNDAPLMIGMTAETNIIVKKSDNTLLIPFTALGKDNKVILIENGTAKIRTVKPGIKGTDSIEILSGLTTDDTIAIKFDPSILDGQKIRGNTRIESAE
jgi:RND family efflux transporter MFP subunit